MSHIKPISITIFEKEYLINCEENEQESLRIAVEYVNQKMLELKKIGNVIGAERIAVMTALNVSNELLTYKKENQNYTFKVDSVLKRLQGKISSALATDRKNDTIDINQQVSQGG